MTLHDAIVKVLNDNKRAMSANEIADQIIKLKLYRKRDGSPVPTSQIHIRVRRYPALFKKTPYNEITLVTPSTNVTPTDDVEHLSQSKYNNKLTLENFRTYKSRSSIDLAPITILTGKNNAGKSTIFKSLILLSDYLNSDNQLILEFDGPMAHKHKIDCIDNALTWGSNQKYFTLEHIKDEYTFSFTFGKDKEQGVLFKMKITDDKNESKLYMVRLSKSSFAVELDSSFININLDSSTSKYSSEIDDLNKIIRRLRLQLRKVNMDISSIEDSEKGSENHILLVESRNTLKRNTDNIIKQRGILSNKIKESEYKIEFEIDLSDTKEFRDSKITTLIRRGLMRHFSPDKSTNESNTDDYNRSRFKLMRFFDSLDNSMTLDVYHLGPNRTHQARLYINRNRENEINEIMNFYAHNKPSKGSQVDIFLKKWMRKFDIGDDIKVKDVQATASFIEITDNGKEQNLTDKGFGAGQVLTMLMKISNEVYNLRSPSRAIFRLRKVKPIIIIEEPETNLHPEFQSKLAEMFYDANKQFNIRFILETHSEYLIRKTQSIIKNTQDYNVFKIYYVDKTKGLYEMRYREDGKFFDEFGTGFFDESTNLTLDLY